MSIKILHTSDIHLEARLDFLGSKAGEHRSQLLATFEKLVDKAVSEKYDLVVIAGDLFDTPFPGEVIKTKVLEQFKKLQQNKIRLAVITGNHDYLTEGSVFYEEQFQQFDPALVKIFSNPEQPVWEVPELDLTVVGVSLFQQKDNNSPLDVLAKVKPKTKYSLGLIHGSLVMGNDPANNPIRLEQLKALSYNYIALGDWHSVRQACDKPQTWYSGSPELINVDQLGAGNFLAVEISENSTKVVQNKIGARQAVKLELDITGVKTLAELKTRLMSQKLENPKSSFLNLKLVGSKELNAKIDEKELLDLLGNEFYYLKLKDASKLELSKQQLEQFPEELLIGKYIRLLQQQKGEDYSQNQIIDEAIQLGVRLLQN